MRSVRRGSIVLALIAGAVIAAATPGAAWAEDPVSFGSSPVVDTVGALGGSLDDVERAIDEAADASGRQLFVAYVDEFTNPAAADAWADETAIANNLGAEDYLLAVAIDGRAYYLSADAGASLSDEELNRISLEVIEPELRDGDWAGAAIAGAEAIGGTGGGGGGGVSWGFIWFLVIAGAVVIVIAIVLARRKKRKQVEAGTSAGGPPLPSIDELRRTAGSALVQADDAVKTSEEELGFAVASYGEEATADFRTALDGAKAKLAEAFTLQQRLDDAEPDSDEERRAWYGGIIQLAGEADAMLDEQAERFDELRDLERTAPEALARIEAAASGVEQGIEPASQRLAALQAQYAPSALASIADNPAQARARMSFAREELAEASTALGQGEAAKAAVGIRAAEEAVDQAQLLSDRGRAARRRPRRRRPGRRRRSRRARSRRAGGTRPRRRADPGARRARGRRCGRPPHRTRRAGPRPARAARTTRAGRRGDRRRDPARTGCRRAGSARRGAAQPVARGRASAGAGG